MSVFDEKKLRARLGVRDDGLIRICGSELGALLHVHPSDGQDTVLVKVLHQLEKAIPEVVERAGDADILAYSCNTPRDPVLNSLDNQEKRLELLAERRGPKRRSADKRVATLGLRLVQHWRARPPAPPTSAELDRLRQAEEEYRATGVGVRTDAIGPDRLTRLIESWNSSGRGEIEDLLERWVLHFETDSGFLATTETADRGEYLCVFTSSERLAEYQRTRGGPPGAPGRAGGGDLLGLAARSGIGLVVDPVVGGLGSTYWTAEEVARRWAGGR
ncbi:hypothetical protein [Saccharothrix stipae]